MPNISHPVLAAIFKLAVPLTLWRYNVNGWQPNGEYDENVDFVKTIIQGTVQAPSQEDLRARVEGERSEGYVTIHTTERLRITSEAMQTRGDEIELDGLKYRIISADWRAEAGFSRALGRLIHDRSRNL